MFAVKKLALIAACVALSLGPSIAKTETSRIRIHIRSFDDEPADGTTTTFVLPVSDTDHGSHWIGDPTTSTAGSSAASTSSSDSQSDDEWSSSTSISSSSAASGVDSHWAGDGESTSSSSYLSASASGSDSHWVGDIASSSSGSSSASADAGERPAFAGSASASDDSASKDSASGSIDAGGEVTIPKPNPADSTSRSDDDSHDESSVSDSEDSKDSEDNDSSGSGGEKNPFTDKDTIDIVITVDDLCTGDGESPMSVLGVDGVFCVTGEPCVAGVADGACPGAQEGLPYGAYCGEVMTGVYGCQANEEPSEPEEPADAADAPVLCAGEGRSQMSVEGVNGIFCVRGPACVADNPDGACPDPQEGLPYGAECGKVASGVYGCMPKPAERRHRKKAHQKKNLQHAGVRHHSKTHHAKKNKVSLP